MQSLFTTIYTWIQWIFGVVPKSARGSKTLFRVIHYAIVILATAALAYFSDKIVDPADVGHEWEFVKRCWVGVLFILIYLFVRLLIYLINLLLIQDEPEFRDIDRCWQIGMSELQRAGLDITYLPVFLVNGLSMDDEQSLFQSSGMPWKVIAPGYDDRAAVLRFLATDDALFISLTGVGTSNLQRMQRPVAATGGAGAQPLMSSGPAPARAGTLTPDQLNAARGQAAGPAPAAPVGGRTLPAGMRPGILGNAAGAASPPPLRGAPQRTMMAPGMRGGAEAGAVSSATSAAPARPQMFINRLSPEDHDRGERRMTYLTYLLKRDRAPYCPINGLLQVVPMTWAERTHAPSGLTSSIADDLQVLANELDMLSSLVVVYTELEKLPGFEEFLSRCCRLDGRFHDSRAGSRFPSGKPVDTETSHWVVDRCLAWFQGWTYSGLAQDVDNASNSKLYRLLCELNDRRGRFEQQLKELKISADGRRSMNWRLGGCYFAATGQGSSRQAFTTGVLQKLIGDQNEVSWSDSLLRRDGRTRMLGWGLLTLGLGLAVANAAAVWYLTSGGTTPPKV